MVLKIDENEVPLVRVTWRDHSSFPDQNWRDVDEIDEHFMEGVLCHTVGFLVKETEKSVVIVLTMGENGQFSGVFNILKGTIEEIKNLCDS